MFHARVKSAVQAALHRVGFDLVRYLSPADLLRRRARLLEQLDIGMILDIGANTGQYAMTTRSLGYSGEFVSFEPLRDAFRVLQGAADRDPKWIAVNAAVGSQDGRQRLHVSANSQSSSLVEVLPAHLVADPASRYVRDEFVPVMTLPTALNQYGGDGQRIFVKIDTQGYERHVIAPICPIGDERLLGFQIELSMLPLYEDSALIEDMIHILRQEGFDLVLVEPTFSDPRTGCLLQIDGTFVRSGILL